MWEGKAGGREAETAMLDGQSWTGKVLLMTEKQLEKAGVKKIMKYL